jgi:hypothetical protein
LAARKIPFFTCLIRSLFVVALFDFVAGNPAATRASIRASWSRILSAVAAPSLCPVCVRSEYGGSQISASHVSPASVSV